MKKLLRKIGKLTLVTLIGLIISVNLLIILSGRFYLYKGIANTYLKGQSGPSIYEKDIFYNDTVNKGNLSDPFVIHPKYNTQEIPEKYRDFIESLDTRALLVLKGDTLVYEEYWDEHAVGTVSNSFSIAKTITALLISIAIEEGKIGSLDEPVANYIAEFKTGGRDKITIRHLLQMSSGLDWEESSKNPFSDNAASYYGDDLWGLVTRQKLISEPGKQFNYQSGNSQLLGYIVEKASGYSLTDYAEKMIWSKMGMSGDAFWNLDKENGDEKAFCCFYANARDFARLGQLILQKGKYKGEQIFPEWFFDEMIKPAEMKTEEGVLNYRYGLHIWTYFGDKNPVYYCRGIKGQYIITIPEENLLIIRLGLVRKDNFTIPENKKGDQEYIEQNKYKIGHCMGLFQYIALGRILSTQIEN